MTQAYLERGQLPYGCGNLLLDANDTRACAQLYDLSRRHVRYMRIADGVWRLARR